MSDIDKDKANAAQARNAFGVRSAIFKAAGETKEQLIAELIGFGNRELITGLLEAAETITKLESELSALRKELEEATERYAENEASNKAVELALSDIKYTGSYADGVRQLIKELEERCQSIDRLDGKLQEANRHQISAYLEYQAMCKELEEAKNKIINLQEYTNQAVADGLVYKSERDRLAAIIKEAGEPIGYVRAYGIECLQGTLMNETTGRIPLPSHTGIDPYPIDEDDIPLYAHPPIREEQKPVASTTKDQLDYLLDERYCNAPMAMWNAKYSAAPIKLYTHPPIREGWVMVPKELNDELCQEIACGSALWPVNDIENVPSPFFRAIRAYHKAMLSAVKKDTL